MIVTLSSPRATVYKSFKLSDTTMTSELTSAAANVSLSHRDRLIVLAVSHLLVLFEFSFGFVIGAIKNWS